MINPEFNTSVIAGFIEWAVEVLNTANRSVGVTDDNVRLVAEASQKIDGGEEWLRENLDPQLWEEHNLDAFFAGG